MPPTNLEMMELICLAKQKAEKYQLNYALICSLIEQESNWNTWAIRYEPAFLSRYIAKPYAAGQFSATEAYSRAMSWGLLQLMGQTAREQMFDGAHLSQLCDPEVGLEYGCKFFSALMGKTNNDVQAALLRWNGGAAASYPQSVLARLSRYNA